MIRKAMDALSDQSPTGKLLRYGATATFAVAFYIDFVRPLGDEHRTYLKSSVEQQVKNTLILEKMAESSAQQVESMEALTKLLSEKNQIMTEVIKSQESLRESQDAALEILKDIHKQAERS